jgi:hypothetical protein
MPRIALGKIRDDRAPIEYRLKLEAALNDELLLYQQLYSQAYGQAIEPKDLLEPIIRRFLANDRAFRKFKKDRAAKHADSQE